jgi:nucleoside-diphosphate-sugar epimerase
MAGHRVFVTGGTGFVGAHVVAALVAAGHEVFASARAGAPALSQPGVRWVALDLLDAGAVTAAMAEHRPTHMVHLGWRAVRGDIYASPENLDWLIASLHLARAFREAGGQRFVGCGSCYEYAFGPGPLKEETTPERPASLYGAAKVSLRVALERYGALHGLSAAWGRIFFAYGPGEFEKRLVPDVIGALRRGEQARTTHGRFGRDFVFVADIADAFVKLTEADAIGTFNIGSGQAPLLCDIISEIGALVGRSDLLQIGALEARPGEPEEIRADATRMATVIGWRATTPLAQGLRETIAWHEQTFTGT